MKFIENKKVPRREVPIRTTFFELIEELSLLMDNDNLVVAAVKNIFKSYRVRNADSLAPIRLVAMEPARQSGKFPRLRED